MLAVAPGTQGDAPVDPQTSKKFEAYAASGNRKAEKKDYVGASADYTRCIESSPRNAQASYSRGVCKQYGSDKAGAIRDYEQAIALNPKLSDPYHNLAVINTERHNYQAAETDINRALALKSDEADSWYVRAVIRFRLGHDSEAAKDLARTITFPPQSAGAYITRGDAQNLLGHPSEAASDYRTAIGYGEKRPHVFYRLAYFEAQEHRYAAALDDAQRSPRQRPGHEADYAQLLAWTLQAQLGDAHKADGRLSDYLAARPRTAEGEWAGHVGAFLLGRETSDAFFAHAASGDTEKVGGQRCEAWYYAGMKQLATGNKAAAADCFRKCVATGKKTFTEYHLAQAEQRTL